MGVLELRVNGAAPVEVETTYKYTSVFIYPVPANDRMTVRVNNIALQDHRQLSLKLYSLTGEVVMDLTQSLADVNDTTGTIDVNVSDVSSGVYILVIHGGNVREFQKAHILH